MDEFMKKQTCDRCHGPLKMRTLSVMNMDVLCMECKEKEHHHPKYSEAANMEREEVLKGNTDFKGMFAGKVYPFE